jgi:site-specific recombinase XerD
MSDSVVKQDKPTIGREIERFLAQRAARSPHTARTYRTGLSHFVEYLAERGILPGDSPQMLNRDVALDFIPWLAQLTFQRAAHSREQSLSMRSRQLYVRAVSGLYRQLALDARIPLSYSDYVALNAELGKQTSFKPPPVEKRLPTEDLVQAIIEAVQSPPPQLSRDDLNDAQRARLNLIWLRDLSIILSLYSTGMRVGELVKLRRGDLNYRDRGAWVKGKGDKSRFVRFSARAWQALMEYLDARQDGAVAGALADKPLICRHDRAAGDKRRLSLSTLSVERIVTNLAKESRVLDRFNMTPHSFRHYFATRFLGHTGDLALTQDVLGHANPSTTRIYARTTKEQHIRAHESLFDNDNGMD